jgi:hypothetical protein
MKRLSAPEAAPFVKSPQPSLPDFAKKPAKRLIRVRQTPYCNFHAVELASQLTFETILKCDEALGKIEIYDP